MKKWLFSHRQRRAVEAWEQWVDAHSAPDRIRGDERLRVGFTAGFHMGVGARQRESGADSEDLRESLTRAIDDNFPAYSACVGVDATCVHHSNWPEELDELVDAVLREIGRG